MISGAAAGGEGSQNEREREDSPPPDKSVEALTPMAKRVMNPVAKEREQSERIVFAIVPDEARYPDRIVGIALLLCSMQ